MAENQQLLDYLKKVAADLYETRERLRVMESGEQEPIAVVGMGCRLPGGVADPDQLWDLLASGTDAVSDFPQDRGWDAIEEAYRAGLAGADGADPGDSIARVGGFVYDAAEFDAGFFGISPREALAMDPQQRLVLEVSWEAVERAGISPAAMRGTQTGVFVGSNFSGYGANLVGTDSGSEGYLLTGGLTAVISGRVSYTLGLEGPALTVDTACSSALVALHLACQSLRSGECTMALAGGAAVMSAPGAFAEFSKQQGMATNGRCKPFSADADGIGWAEGAGMVLLEKLSDAQRNGHQILAVVRGSAVNQDGASNGLTAPNGPSQQRVIRAALASARLSSSDIDAVEAHGTGTTLGDPIEAQALLATYGQDRAADRPLWLGSVKSNIGHPQAAAGVVGLIKMVLALRRGMLPRTLYADQPSPHVDWSAGNVKLLTDAVAWPAADRPRRAGVSAFGVSGTNVHMILEEAPAVLVAESPADASAAEGEQVPAPVLSPSGVSAWVVSGRTSAALAAQAGRLREFTLGSPDVESADVAYALATTRSVFEHRAVVIGSDREQLTNGLAAVATGRPASSVVSGVAGSSGAGRVVFVFPGQGSQWAGMGRELLAGSPVFAGRFAECADALKPFVDWSLYEVLAGAEGAPAMETADVVQPVLWAVMVSLAAVWQAAGVVPDAVVGHSQGEIAAACVAGILSLDDGARVVALRSKALRAIAGKGGMLSLAQPVEQVRARLAAWGDRVSVAAVNGPSATVVSGEPQALRELAAACEADGVRARMIPVDYASHSAQVDALEQEILNALKGITPNAARIPMISAMSGQMLTGAEMTPEYWYASLRSTVEFDRAIRTLARADYQVFIEVSPHPVLTSAITDTLEDAAQPAAATTPVVFGTLRRDEGGPARLLASLAEAFVHGVRVDWTTVLEQGGQVALPTYAFQRQRYWALPAPVTQTGSLAASGSGSEAEARFWAAVEGGDLRALADTLSIDNQSLSEVLPALASWRRQERDESVVANWRYRVSWVPVAGGGRAPLSGTWLIAVPAGRAADPLIENCVQALASRGARTEIVEVGPDHLDRCALAARLAEAVAALEDDTVAGVLSLLALADATVADVPMTACGTVGTLLLVQALGDAGVTAPLWSATQGAVSTSATDRLANPVQAQVWGLGLVAGLETPDRWGGLIDLPADWDDRAAAALCSVLGGGGEDQVALRPSGVVARRLVRAAPVRAAGRAAWTARGTVLVTGGTGQIGPHLITWLAGRGAERVVLTSRSGPSASAAGAAVVAALAEAGTSVQVVACDLAQRARVAALLDRIAADGPPLTCVLHAANAVELASVDDATPADLEQALGAKATGARLLDELTADLDLDAFVLFSSIAATWGSNEHAAYAAGNAYLDALAHNRRARGLPGTSVAWGVWDTRDWSALDSQASQAVGTVTPAKLRRQGMTFLAPRRALAALEQALTDDETFLAVADVEWDKFAPVYTAVRAWPFLTEIPEVRRALTAAPAQAAATGQAGELARRLAALPAPERERLVVDLVRTHAAAVLGYGSGDEVSAGRAFRDMGFDSLTAVDLRNRLNKATGLVLPSTVVFDYPSAAVLARQVIALVLGTQKSATQGQVTVVAADEPIAIVGMGCRFPGGVVSPQDLWDLVAAGGDAVSGFPLDRGWDTTDLFDPDPDNPGTSYVQEGGFLRAAADFDAGFFGISPREALAMDPQQRLVLETSWEALERAGIDPESLRGSLTGVFAGAAPSGYASQVAGIEGTEGHLITGNVTSVVSGRVSYTLGLEGPAVTVDTACSSSLVALHLAAQALRSGDCTLALAGGVMVMADAAEFIGFSRQRALASDGRCKAFSADADGMGIAEGAGMILLERLSDAERNGHHVLAVIRGSAVNQDGASNGLTAPNGPSQQRVIRAALANARLNADDVDVVEAHGTGTALGDPIEAQALLATYGQDRSEDRPLWLGSVKSNIGHAQQAAGVAGIIKMVLALQHGELPRTLHAQEASPHIDWSAGDVRLLTEPVAWPVNGRLRRAGVSAFGISGTNAHVIVEEAPTADASVSEDEPETATPPLVGALPDANVSALLVSGRSADALAAQAGTLREFVAGRRDLDLADIAWSLATTRSAFEHRAVVIGTDRENLAAGLAAVATGQAAPGVVSGSVPTAGIGRVGFLFSGQGSQRAGMGRELYAASPVFAAAFDEVSAALEAELGRPVADVVLGRDGAQNLDANQTVFAQTGLFALQVGLLALLDSCGVRPDAVVGHSVGEIAAAYAAGVLSLTDACRLVAVRARLMQDLPAGGAMCAIGATEAAVLETLAGVAGIGLAAVNGPTSVVVSGDEDAVGRVAELWRGRGARVRDLRVSHAFHSARMDPAMAELARVAESLDHAAPRVPWACGLTGEVADEYGPEYWPAQARRAVRYADAVAALAARGVSVFIELGPDGTLSALGAGALPEDSAAIFIPLLHKEEPASATFLAGLARAHVQGAAVDWPAALGTGETVELPTYAFQRRRFWPDATPAALAGTAHTDGATADDEDFWAAVEGGRLQQLADTLTINAQSPLSEVMPALAAWRRRRQDDSAVADWRYRITWTPVTDQGPAVLTGTWLAIVPARRSPLVEDVVRALTERGAHVVEVEVGPEHLDRTVLADRLSGSPARLEGADPAGVLSLLALDESPIAEYPVVHAGVAGTLLLVQALADADIAAPLWALTQGAVAVEAGDALTSPIQAQIWGLGRVAGLEHPDRWGGLVDLPSSWDERIAARLCSVLAARGEDQVAVRSTGVVARRLARAPRSRVATPWSPSGTVLVTGGTGGIGGQVGRWLAGRGAPRLVLSSRSGPAAAGVAALVADLAEAGSAVNVVAADATRRGEVANLLARVAADGPNLVGVIHAAGLGEATSIDDFSLARLAAVSAVKTAGAMVLDELTADLGLEAFVLFSSISATWGSGLQPGYAAANAFLDALAENRRSRGLAATSVAWGLWGGEGMGSGPAGEHLQRYGLRLMDPELGIRALAQAVDGRETALAVADVEWERFAPTFTVRRSSPLISTVPEAARALAVESGPATAGSRTELGRRLAGLSVSGQDRLLVDLVRAEAARVLGHPSADAVDAARAFNDLGFDSLTSVELRGRLSTVTGLALPATVAFDYPNAKILAGYLRGELLGVTAGPDSTPMLTAAVDGEPIAVVGMGCRLPGGVGSPEQLWDLVATGTDAVAPFPRDRGWEVYDPELGTPGSYAQVGGFVYDAAEFDAGFFGISPREAQAMDPQQRLLLEVSWEALERAGIDPATLRGSQTGVFAGASSSGYDMGLLMASMAGEGSQGHLATGNAISVISGRVAYTFGLEGPAVTIDTACSSSMVALHLAAQALRSGECSLALAGGVTVMATPGAFGEFSKQQGMAADGRCKPFSADADGTGWAEGAGMVLLERLSDARRNGHKVLAVVRGSAVNQDGASNGLTAPNGPAQQRVIRAALANARVSSAEVDVVEAHGTGTALGDPIEAQALLATYGRDRSDGRPLWLGSVKSNIGHPQAAAGVAGLIKMVMALQHQQIPRTLHAAEPTPHVNWSAGAVRLLNETVAWPVGDRPRRAGVSAFGMSGTNAHVILEEAPAADTDSVNDEAPAPAPEPAAAAVLSSPETTAWLVSGRTAESLTVQAGQLREFVLARPETDPADIAWSLATTRSVFENRAVVIGSGRETLAAGLAAVATGQPATGVVSGAAAAGGAGRVVFVFPGQGSQWLGMGRELLACSPVFAARLAECAEALAPFVDWSLTDVLAGAQGAPALESADVVQPALWAVMVSLAALWQAAGVVPDALVGHSQGEIAAACVAGILSLEDGARVVALRSKALTAIAGKGGMLSIAESADAVRARLTRLGDRVSVAAVNGPSATVVSGEPKALKKLAATCEAAGVRARMIPVDYASHSAQVDALEDEILSVLTGITPGPAQIPMISAVTGQMLSGPEMDPAYWYTSLRSTVEFDRAIRTLVRSGHQAFVEVSPHPVLTTAVADTVEAASADPAAPALAAPAVFGTLRRDEGGPARLLASFAQAHVQGVRVDWAAVLGHGARTDLPTYAFQHRRYWPKIVARPVTSLVEDAFGGGEESRFWAAVEDGDLRELADTLAIADDRLSEVLPALASWRRRERDDSAVAGWRYRVTWLPVPDARKAALTGTWLVVAPAEAGGPVADCLRALAQGGAQTALVEVGAQDLDRAALAARIAAAAAQSPAGRFAGVLSFLALDESPVTGFPAVANGVAGLLVLAQALGDAGVPAPLWAITCGAVSTGPGDVLLSPTQAQTWGLGRVVGLEYSNRWGGLIDLPRTLDDRAAARLCSVLADSAEDQIAVRADAVLRRRLVRAQPRRAGHDEWRPRGTVLITGATGEVGPYLVPWLAGRGAEQVVLTSRSGVRPGTGTVLARLAVAGTGVSFVACDVARRSHVAGLVDWIGVSGSPLKTVIHAANAVDLTPLEVTGVPELAKALGAKASGAAWLDELTADLDLDAFVLFSSIAATWGSNEHGAYAAGNAYLDALAENRRARGLQATTVAWGVWDTRDWAAIDADAAQTPGSVTPSRLKRQGMNFLDPQRALVALEQVLADDETFLAVADIDWAKFAPVYGAIRAWPLLNEIPEVQSALTPSTGDGATGTAAQTGELARSLSGLSGPEQERLVVDLVRTHAAAVLGFATADEVSAGRAFRDLGFDSLTAVDLRNRLNQATGLVLPSTVVFDYPSANTLARQVIRQLLGTQSSTDSPQAPTIPADPAEPLAIVGMGCRFPGGVSSPDELWDLLIAGGDAVSGFPTDRGWDMTGLFDPDPDSPRTSYVQEGGFLHGAAQFDAGFFGISPREAMAMDPQQRLLLETSWEALELAGLDPESLRGSLTGVFVGAAPSGYLGQAINVEGAEGHLITGNAISVLSGRLSYTLGLEGPAVTVETACSSSLVALHLAGQALRSGECSMALVGGVMVMADPAEFIGFSRQRALASDGRCKAFSDDADGMGIAEGAGMLLVERLSDARRHGHQVLAVVRGSATNQDGASNGLTAPNGPSQQRVIRAALANARLSSAEVDAVEAHGTGTALGDPIEAQALLATYGQERSADRPLWLGSVKSNIGHTQQAAGMAGLIKMVLALKNEVLPRTLHAERPSRHVDWASGNVRLLTEAMPWPGNGHPRRAGVSAFGISGTNAHIILEQAPVAIGDLAEGDADADVPDAEGARAEAEPIALPVLADAGVTAWPVSGRGAAGLAGQAGRLREFTDGRPDLSVADAAWSLATTRSVFEHRAVVVGADREQLAAGLGAVENGRSAAGAVFGAVGTSGPGRVVFVFPGQGSQWAGMGRELLAGSPVFAGRFAECADALKPFVDWSLYEVLAGAEGAPAMETADVVQPVLWAVMVSLAAVWQAAGVVPDAVVGHSQGEIAAACVAGILSTEDAARVVALRSKALRAIAGQGGMLSVAEPVEQVRVRLAAWGERASVAAVNGPSATIVSGEPQALRELAAVCEAAGVRARMIPVDYASHSAQVDALEQEILNALQGIAPDPARIPMISAMSGQMLTGAEMTPEYWYASLRSTVEFDRAIRTLAETGHRTFIEVSPHPVLTSPITDTVEAAGVNAPTITGTLRRDEGGPARLLASLAEVYVRGIPVDWTTVLDRGQTIQLPTYAFQHQHFWPKAHENFPPAAGSTATASDAAESAFWAAIENGDVNSLADTLSVEDRHLAEVLPALATWRRRETQDCAVADWRYRITWAPVTGQGAPALTGTWLIAVPAGRTDDEPVQACIRALTERGVEPLAVEIGPADLDRAALAARLATTVTGLGDTALAGVLSLLAFDQSPTPALPVVPFGAAATLVLVQALGDAAITARLWAVTRGAVSTVPGDELTSPAQAQIWGLGRVAGLEHPDRWGGLIDLPPAWDERAAARLRAVLADGAEDQVAIRAAGVLARRLVRAGQPAKTSAPWTPSGTVLVTGGTGGIGGRVGRWLADRGAPRVVLTSRSGPTAAGAPALAAHLAESGAQAEVIACDIAARADVATLLSRIAADAGPDLSGVVHAAGLGEVTAIDDFSLDQLSTVSAVKTAGAAALDELTAGLGLEAFVLFSSISATWGSGMQPGYAAANAFLDALAENRRARGLPATSVAWGLWGGGGMGDGVAGEQLQRYGLRVMDPDLGIRALAQAVDGNETAISVADVDWDRFAPTFTLRRPSALLSSLPDAVRALAAESAGSSAASAASPSQSQSDLVDRLAGLPAAEQERILTDLVLHEAATALGFATTDEVQAGRAFKDLGFESVTAVDLRNRLNAATGLRLPSTLVFDYPNPEALAGYVRTLLVPADASAGPGSIHDELDRLESSLGAADSDPALHRDVTRRLQSILSHWIEARGSSAGPDDGADIEFGSATPDEVFDFLDNELGLS